MRGGAIRLAVGVRRQSEGIFYMKLFILVILTAAFSGCVSSKKYVPKTVKGHQVERFLGPEATVGSPMVKIQDYFFTRTESIALKPDIPFKMYLSGGGGGEHTISYAQDSIFPIKATRLADGKKQFLVHLGMGAWIAVTTEGIPIQKRLGLGFAGYVAHAGKLLLTPNGVTFTFMSTTHVLKNRGYLNYELIYSGISGNTINLLYREFSHENIARAAFFQNLSYDLSKSKEISFRKLKLRIKSADNNSIKYTVLAHE